MAKVEAAEGTPDGKEKTNLRRHDSLDIESAKVKGHHGHSQLDPSWGLVLTLAFQSIGVIYGDIGTSPLYVYESTFTNGIKRQDDILGVLSLIYYTITLIPLIKYVFIVLRANDNGNGGTFALYSLLCRNVKVGLLPNQHPEDQQVSTYKLELPSNKLGIYLKVKNALENSKFAKFFLLIITMLATALVIGDGILTPCISVLSAVGGVKAASPSLTEDAVIGISIAILICLFSIQRFGTDKVGYTFAPIISIWFAMNASFGIYNFVKYDPTVIKALNPWYIIEYFRMNGKDAWISLGGVVLCITGTEALFADLGHFSVKSIQISMSCVTYPSILLAYSGQASFLRAFPEKVDNTFYDCIPGPFYWPMFIVAVLSAIIASQAMISGTFSIIMQSLSLGCFPRVTVVHTSAKYEGQVYIPELNYIMMVACVIVCVMFRTTEKIGNAYGIAVVLAETITSFYMILVMILIWKKHIIFAIIYVCCIMSIEVIYLSAVLYKFTRGGFFPIAIAIFLMIIMFTWNYVYRKRYHYEEENKVSPETIKEIAHRGNLSRIPGVAIFYSELAHGIPPIFSHYLDNIHALHSVVVCVSIKSLPISKVPPEERFLFRRVNPRELFIFRCVVRYGYTDAHSERENFEEIFMERLKEFVRDDFFDYMARNQIENHRESAELASEGDSIHNEDNNNNNEMTMQAHEEELHREMEFVDKAWRHGVVHMLGESQVVARKGSNIGKRVVIDYAYNFMKKNLRQAIRSSISHVRSCLR